MNGDRVIPLLLVACSLFVLGTMAASLDATVTSSPRDGIDVDTDSLPFVGDGVSEVAVSYDEGSDGQPRGAVESRDDAGGDAGNGADQGERAGGGAAEQPDSASDGQREASSGSGGDGSQQADRGGGDSGSAPGDESPGDSLWTLLARLLRAALVLLAVLAILAAIAYAIRRRDRLLALLWTLAVRYGLVSPTDAVPGSVPGDDGAASTVVERAWAEMLRRSGARCAASDTPRECAAAAVAAGVDREPAEELTSLYERVRYGRRSVTPDHASRALGLLREVSRRPGGRRA